MAAELESKSNALQEAVSSLAKAEEELALSRADVQELATLRADRFVMAEDKKDLSAKLEQLLLDFGEAGGRPFRTEVVQCIHHKLLANDPKPRLLGSGEHG